MLFWLFHFHHNCDSSSLNFLVSCHFSKSISALYFTIWTSFCSLFAGRLGHASPAFAACDGKGMPSGSSSGIPKMYCGCEGTLLLTAAFGRRNKAPADWTSGRASGRISWLQQHSVCVRAVTFCAIKESGWFILGDVQPFLLKRKK